VAGADEFARAAGQAIHEGRSFHVALAGGSTPVEIYRRLTKPPHRGAIPWERIRFYWGDERCVPPDDERSNFRMAREALFEPLGIPPRQVFRMKGEEDPVRAARSYEDTLRRRVAGRPPRLDLVLLGLGTDGHTASLFPDTAALVQERRLVAANFVPKFPEWRITLTLRAINSARRVIFLVAGAVKAAAAAKILDKQPGYRALPASRVAPRRGTLLWLLDEAAASRL